MTVLKGLDTRLKLAKLHLITDTRSRQGDLKDFLVAAINGGVDLVELRDANASEDELVEALELARSVALQLDAGVIVGGNPGVAERFGADYLHLGAAAGQADRGGLSEFAILGRSVHREEQVRAAAEDDAIGFMLVGPVFGPAELGVDGLALVRQAAEIAPVGEGKPWFAVGSITEKNISEVISAGALRVSVSAALTGAKDPQAVAERLKAALQEAWDGRPELEKYSLSAFGGGPAATLIGAAPVMDEQGDQGSAGQVEDVEPVEVPAEVTPQEEAPVQEAAVEQPTPATLEVADADPQTQVAPVVEDAPVAADDARALEGSDELPADPATAEVPEGEQAVPAPHESSEDLNRV